MVPAPCVSTAPVPPPAYQRAVAKRGPVLHSDALTLVTRLHLLTLCGLAVRQAPRRSSDASLLLIALRTLWRLSPRYARLAARLAGVGRRLRLARAPERHPLGTQPLAAVEAGGAGRRPALRDALCAYHQGGDPSARQRRA